MNKKYIAIIVLTILGMINAFYLSYEAYQIAFVNNTGLLGNSFCDINSTFSCTSFFNKPESLIFGIPFPWIAAIVYPVLFILSVIGYTKKSVSLAKVITILAIGGLCFNGVIISREFTVGVFCPLCLMCTGYIFVIGLLGGSIWRENCKKIAKK